MKSDCLYKILTLEEYNDLNQRNTYICVCIYVCKVYIWLSNQIRWCRKKKKKTMKFRMPSSYCFLILMLLSLNSLQNCPGKQCWAHEGLRHVAAAPSQQPGFQWGYVALFKTAKNSSWPQEDWQQMNNFLL